MQYSIVNFSNLESISFRLDAEYYKPTYIETEGSIKKHNWDYLANLSSSIKSFGAYSLCNQIQYVSKGIPFLRCKDIKDGSIDFSEVLFINKDTNKLLWKSEVKPKTVLFTMSGTVGNSAIATENLGYPINSNQDIAKIVTNEKLNPYYLSIFLQSKHGKRQSNRLPIGSVQQHIFLWQLERLIIPLFSDAFQSYIENIFKYSLTFQTNSQNYFLQAQTLLLSELGLLDWKPKHQLTFVKNFSDTQKAGRIDAEYFQPKYDEIVDKINAFETIELGDKRYFDIVTGTYINEYTPEGEYYIRSVDINNDLTIETDNMYKTKEKLASKFRVKDGDIVTSRVGSIGTLGFVSEELDGSFISDNILRIRNKYKDLDSLFLAFYLKIVGSILMERLSRGSVQQRLNQETLKEIEIPILEHETQKKITEKVFASHQLKKQSKHLLECAKRAVEMAIEEDEDTATEWLNKEVCGLNA